MSNSIASRRVAIVPQQVGLDPFRGPCLMRDFPHHLPDALAGIDTRSPGALLAADEQRPGVPFSDVHGRQVGQLSAERYLPSLAALASLDDDHPFSEAGFFHPEATKASGLALSGFSTLPIKENRRKATSG